MSWLWEAISSGFTEPTEDWHLQAVRIMFGLACLAKFVHGATGGGWQRFRNDDISSYLFAKSYGTRSLQWMLRSYRPALITRIIAATLLTAGICPRLFAVLTVLGLFFEMLFIPRSLTFFMACTGIALACAGNLGSGFSLDDSSSTDNTWAQVIVMILALDLYINTAWLKIRSPQFRSGQVISQWLASGRQIQYLLPAWNYYYPQRLVALMATNDGNPTPLARTAAWGTIALEFLIPIGLLNEVTRPAAIAAGIGMHTAFAGLLPRHLAAYSLCSTGAYFAFLNS
ncbi:hypothetical protein ACGFYY_40105 [Streptomyces sp. NPDC048331]|uniref:hypothetical protein n=1 Tax=Streptomyces sp. NPDC048331 TaxID=3365534 RepID=UPI003722054B